MPNWQWLGRGGPVSYAAWYSAAFPGDRSKEELHKRLIFLRLDGEHNKTFGWVAE